MAKNSYSDHNPYEGQPLSAEEKEVLRLLAADYTTSAIVSRIFVSVSKYDKMVRIIKQKLKVHSLIAAYAAARKRRWI